MELKNIGGNDKRKIVGTKYWQLNENGKCVSKVSTKLYICDKYMNGKRKFLCEAKILFFLTRNLSFQFLFKGDEKKTQINWIVWKTYLGRFSIVEFNWSKFSFLIFYDLNIVILNPIQSNPIQFNAIKFQVHEYGSPG